MFFLILACLCLGILNIHLVLLVVAITMFIAYPVLLFIPIGAILLFFILKEEKL